MATYSYPISMPTSPGFTKSKWSLERAVAVNRSPFTGDQSTYEYDLALWKATLTLPPMKRAQAKEWQAFFMKLHGRRGTFLLGDPDAREATGTATSAAVSGTYSLGGDQVGLTLNGSLNIGDFVQLGSDSNPKYYMVVNNIAASGTVDIEPPLKASVTTSTPVTISSPKGEFRMDNNELGWDANALSNYGITFSCTEAM